MILGDPWYRNELVLSKDLYHCHPDELTEQQRLYLVEYMALDLATQDSEPEPDIDKALKTKA